MGPVAKTPREVWDSDNVRRCQSPEPRRVGDRLGGLRKSRIYGVQLLAPFTGIHENSMRDRDIGES